MSNSNDQSINKLDNQNLGRNTTHLIKVGKRQRQNLSGIEQKLKQNYFLNTQQLLRHLSPQTTPQIQNKDTLSEYSIKQKNSLEINQKTHKKSKTVNPGNDIISQLRDASANTYSQDSWKKNRRAKSVSQSRQKVLQTSYNRQSFRNQTMNKELSNSETHGLETGIMGQQSGGCNSISKKKIEFQKLISKNVKKNKFLIQQNHLKQILEAQKIKQKKQNLSQRNEQVRLNNAKKKKPRSQSCIEGGKVRDKLRNRSLDQVKKDFVSVDDFKHRNLIDQLNQLTHQMEKEISTGSQKHQAFKRQTRNNMIQTAPIVKSKQKTLVDKKQLDPFVALKHLVNSGKFENISDKDVGSPDSRRQEGYRPTDVQEFIQKKKKLIQEQKTLEYVKEMDKALKVQQNLVQLNQYVQKHMRHKSQPFNFPKKYPQDDFVKVISPKTKENNKKQVFQVDQIKKKVKNISELGFKQEKQSGARKKKLKDKKFEITQLLPSTQNKNLKNVILNENSERTIINNEDRKDNINKKQYAQIQQIKSPIQTQKLNNYQSNNKQEVTFNQQVKIKNVFGQKQQNTPSQSNNESHSGSNIDFEFIQQNQIEYSNNKKEQGASPQSIEKLRRIQELVGLYRCKFKEGTSDASIMGKLHSAASVIQINFRYIQHLRSIQSNQLNSFSREKIQSQQFQIQSFQQNQQYLQQLNSEQNQVQNRINESNQASQNQDYFDNRTGSQMSVINNIKNINMSTQSKQLNDTFVSESQNQNTQQKFSSDNNNLQQPVSLEKKFNKAIYQESLNQSINKQSNEKNQIINKDDLKLELKYRSQTVNNNLIHEDFNDSIEISDQKNQSLQKLNTSYAENSIYGNRNPQVPGLNLQKLGVQTSQISNSDISSSMKKKSVDENESSSILNPSAQAKSIEKISKQRSPNSSQDNQKRIQDLIKIENLDESFQKQLQLSNKEKSGGRLRAQSNDADDRYQNELETQSKQGPISDSNYSEIFNRIGLPLPKSARVQIDYNLMKRDPAISEQLREVIKIKKDKGIEVLREAKKFNLISERTTLANQKKLEKWVTLALNRIDQEKIGTQSRRSFGAVSLGEFSGRNGGKQSITNEELITLAVNGKYHLDKLMGTADYEKLSARSGTNEKMSARSIRQPNSFRSQSWRANGVSGINSQTDFDKIDPYQNSNIQSYKNKNQKLVGLINKNSSRSSTHQEQQQDLSDKSSGRQVSPKVDSQEANQESIKKVAQIEKQLENALEKQHNEVRTSNQKGLIFVENQAQEASFTSGGAFNSGEVNTSIQSSFPAKINNSSYFKHDSSLFDGSHLESDDNKEVRGSGQKNVSSTWIDESLVPSEDDKKQKDLLDKKLSTLKNNFMQDVDQNQQNNMLVSPLSSQQIYEFKIQTGAHSLSSNDSEMQKGLRASLHEPLDSPPNLLSPKSVGGISITVGGGGISIDQKSDTISPQSQSLSQVVSGSGIPLRKNDGDTDQQLISDSSQQKLDQEQENPQIAFIADKFSDTILQVLLYDLQFEMDFVIPRKGKEENVKKQKGQTGGYQIKFFDKKGIKTDLFAIEKYVDEILEEVKLQSKDFMREILKPVNQDELLVLYQIQTSEIGNFTHFQPKLPDILSLDLYLRIEKRRKESREKGQLQIPISDGLFDFENVNESDLTADRVDKNFLAECLHIHNKIIFDCINDSLQQFRPNGKDGLPKSWSTQNRKLKATEDFSLEEMFEITKHDLFRMAIMQAGTLPRREFVFSGQFDEDLFGEIREKKLATLLCREIVDTEIQWLKWEFEESQTKIDIADMVLETLIVETVDFLNKQQHEASLLF